MAEPDRRTASHGDDPGALLDLATSIALEAGELLVAASRSHGERSALARGAVRKTPRTDLATEADQQSEQLIAERLLLARPSRCDCSPKKAPARPSTSGLIWIVDPLDGTTNFVYDFAPWSVSIFRPRTAPGRCAGRRGARSVARRRRFRAWCAVRARP